MDPQTTDESLVDAIQLAFGDERAKGLALLLNDLGTLGVIGVDRFRVKLRRGLKSRSEVLATLREGVYARDFAKLGGAITVEPHGPKGPDLGIALRGASANIEIKWLTDGDFRASMGENLEEWWADESDPAAHPLGRDRQTARVRRVIQNANSQLIAGEANLILLSDWSLDIARGNFRRATEDLETEIKSNGTYDRISLIEYDSNWHGLINTHFWSNPYAAIPLDPDITSIAAQAGAARAREFKQSIERLVSND